MLIIKWGGWGLVQPLNFCARTDFPEKENAPLESHIWRLLQPCVNLLFFITFNTDLRKSAHWSPYGKALKWGIFLIFFRWHKLVLPLTWVKGFPWPTREPGWQLCGCRECRAQHQLASPAGYLWSWDMHCGQTWSPGWLKAWADQANVCLQNTMVIHFFHHTLCYLVSSLASAGTVSTCLSAESCN